MRGAPEAFLDWDMKPEYSGYSLLFLHPQRDASSTPLWSYVEYTHLHLPVDSYKCIPYNTTPQFRGCTAHNVFNRSLLSAVTVQKVLVNVSSIFLSIFWSFYSFISPIFSVLAASWSNSGICSFFHPPPQPSHKPKGISITTFGHGTEPSCTCGCSTRSAFSSSCMLPRGQWGIWGRIWEAASDMIPHSACQPDSMRRHLVS